MANPDFSLSIHRTLWKEYGPGSRYHILEQRPSDNPRIFELRTIELATGYHVRFEVVISEDPQWFSYEGDDLGNCVTYYRYTEIFQPLLSIQPRQTTLTYYLDSWRSLMEFSPYIFYHGETFKIVSIDDEVGTHVYLECRDGSRIPATLYRDPLDPNTVLLRF